MKKTVLITGANKGIGFEMAKQLGKKDFHVVITGRNEAKLNHALHLLEKEGGSFESIVMDVSNTTSIEKAVVQFTGKHKNLDVLINNAGILLTDDLSIAVQDSIILEKTLLTNCYGPLNVSKAFLPFMKSGARIINVSSGGGSMSDPVAGWSPAYCVSKSMLNAITRHLASELSKRKVSVNAVCPGWTKTDMGGSGAMRMVSKGAETPVWLASEADETLTGKFFRDKEEIDF